MISPPSLRDNPNEGFATPHLPSISPFRGSLIDHLFTLIILIKDSNNLETENYIKHEFAPFMENLPNIPDEVKLQTTKIINKAISIIKNTDDSCFRKKQDFLITIQSFIEILKFQSIISIL